MPAAWSARCLTRLGEGGAPDHSDLPRRAAFDDEHAGQGRRHHRGQHGRRARDGRRRGRAGGNDGAWPAGIRPRRIWRAAKEVTQRTWNDRRARRGARPGRPGLGCARAAEEITTRWDRLDVLVNNAGADVVTASAHRAMASSTPSGVNHLGPFYLTNRCCSIGLRPVRSGPHRQRVTSVGHHAAASSNTACASTTSCRARSSYEGMEAYCRSKLANVPFTREAGQAPRRCRRRDRQRRASRARCAAASAWTATCTGLMGFGHAPHPAVRDQPATAGAKTSLYRGDVTRRGRQDGRDTGSGPSEVI